MVEIFPDFDYIIDKLKSDCYIKIYLTNISKNTISFKVEKIKQFQTNTNGVPIAKPKCGIIENMGKVEIIFETKRVFLINPRTFYIKQKMS